MICTKIVLSFILLKILKTVPKPYRGTVYPYNIYSLREYYTTKLVICQVLLIKKYSISLY